MLQTHRAGLVVSHGLLQVVVMTVALVPNLLNAQDTNAKRIPITLGDYRFSPHQLALEAGQPVLLELTNSDNLTPHNFTLKDSEGKLDIDIDVSAATTREVALTPELTGTYVFYCSKKLPFLKSHREHGMEGTLVVTHDSH